MSTEPTVSYACARCHTPLNPVDPRWRGCFRADGKTLEPVAHADWQHQCPDLDPQAHHVTTAAPVPTACICSHSLNAHSTVGDGGGSCLAQVETEFELRICTCAKFRAAWTVQ